MMPRPFPRHEVYLIFLLKSKTKLIDDTQIVDLYMVPDGRKASAMIANFLYSPISDGSCGDARACGLHNSDSNEKSAPTRLTDLGHISCTTSKMSEAHFPRMVARYVRMLADALCHRKLSASRIQRRRKFAGRSFRVRPESSRQGPGR